MKAIETRYNGYRFRSRTEARWAVFFDTLQIPYEYEVEGFEFDDGTRYLPDFWLPLEQAWFEVKGGYPSEAERRKMTLLAAESGDLVFVSCRNDFALPHFDWDKGEHRGALLHVIDPKLTKTLEGDWDYEPMFGAAWRSCIALQTKHGSEWGCRAHLCARPCNVPPLRCGHHSRTNDLNEAYAAARSARFEFEDADNSWSFEYRNGRVVRG